MELQQINVKDGIDYTSLFMAGYYPYFNNNLNAFYWTRASSRTYLDLTDEKIRKKAKSMLTGIHESYVFKQNGNVLEVLEMLSVTKEKSWVVGMVKNVYLEMSDSGLLKTVEAWSQKGMAGALLGLDFEGIFLAETMFSVENNASKFCLLKLVLEMIDKGYTMIDVQVEHEPDHPSARLGETTVSLREYLKIIWKSAFVLG